MESGEYDHLAVEAAARALWEAHDDQMAVILDATRVLRSAERLGNSARLSQLILQAHDAQANALVDQIAEPLRVAARADEVVRGRAVHPSGVDGITVGITV
jgi:valyl-tRNA synthetase